ncbi:MAG TPA: M20/M25/M40 family metallo-hydrolase [Terriglobales bacterium]|nr:M20/M25/M40 family metallo-hydrolase [Terriglobales bacterium]
MRRSSLTITACLLLSVFTVAQTPAATKPRAAGKTSAKKTVSAKAAVDSAVLQRNIRAHMEFLASDALQGRGSGTQFELLAGTYIASQLRQFGIEPAGDAENGTKGYIQKVAVTQTKFTEAPTLLVGTSTSIHGKGMAVVRTRSANFSGKLQKFKAGDKVQPGAIVLVNLGEAVNDPPVRNQMMAPLGQGAAAVLIADAGQIRQRFAAASKELPEMPSQVAGQQPASSPGAIILLDAETTKAVEAVADGANVEFTGKTAATVDAHATRNVIGVLPGSDTKLSKDVILLSAHMDHIGVREGPGDDKIYNGADDDASGVVAVLELARKLGAGPRPKRTVYFALFGSEERGGVGAQYFLSQPPVPLTDIAANLEFEMIGRGDSAVPADTLWLTGHERTNLGPELAKQGAKIVADPHPKEQFFTRSDNYALARRGVVAQTVSSFGLHKDYHQVSDDIAHIDFDHMTRSINSIFAPVLWLSNSTFKPEWKPSMKP